MGQEFPFPRELILRVIQAPALLDIFPFEKPAYTQVLDLIQKGNTFFIDYSEHEKFFLLPLDIAQQLNLVNEKTPNVGYGKLSSDDRRQLLNEVTQKELSHQLIKGRGTAQGILAVIVSEDQMRNALKEYYVRPNTPVMPASLKFAERRAFARDHNTRVILSLTGDARSAPAPRGPNDGP